MAHDERFAGDTRYLAEFTDGVDVVCPSCSGLALVVGDRGYWTPLRARVTCTTCGYSLGPPARWLGPAVGQVSKRCGMCGTRCERTVRGTVNDRTIHMVCGTCGFEFDEDPTWMPTPTGPHDPHVGLPLHFQRSVGGGRSSGRTTGSTSSFSETSWARSTGCAKRTETARSPAGCPRG